MLDSGFTSTRAVHTDDFLVCASILAHVKVFDGLYLLAVGISLHHLRSLGTEIGDGESEGQEYDHQGQGLVD